MRSSALTGSNDGVDVVVDASSADAGCESMDPSRLRHVLGHFTTGVAVVTARAGRRPVGLAVNSFTSVSLDPPLVAFCVSRTSSTWSSICVTKVFCVNILADDQEQLCRAFATKNADKFAGVAWAPGHSGAPVLGGALAWIECTTEVVYELGDHVMVIGRVHRMGTALDARPLVFYRGDYRHLGDDEPTSWVLPSGAAND
jgi:flavin reductase (DIM6/NTAB) family NADH-FMN oxidoreductase RutF